METFSADDLEHLARQAGLSLDEAEVLALVPQFVPLLRYVELLRAFEVADVEPSFGFSWPDPHDAG